MSMQIHVLETSPIFQQHMHEYDLYFTKAMNGDLGPTAQYWTMYVYMINRVHRDLICAVGTNDGDGYISLLAVLIDIFLDLIDQTTHAGVCCFLSNYRRQTQGVKQYRQLVPSHSDTHEKIFHDLR